MRMWRRWTCRHCFRRPWRSRREWTDDDDDEKTSAKEEKRKSRLFLAACTCVRVCVNECETDARRNDRVIRSSF